MFIINVHINISSTGILIISSYTLNCHYLTLALMINHRHFEFDQEILKILESFHGWVYRFSYIGHDPRNPPLSILKNIHEVPFNSYSKIEYILLYNTIFAP